MGFFQKKETIGYDRQHTFDESWHNNFEALVRRKNKDKPVQEIVNPDEYSDGRRIRVVRYLMKESYPTIKQITDPVSLLHDKKLIKLRTSGELGITIFDTDQLGKVPPRNFTRRQLMDELMGITNGRAQRNVNTMLGRTIQDYGNGVNTHFGLRVADPRICDKEVKAIREHLLPLFVPEKKHTPHLSIGMTNTTPHEATLEQTKIILDQSIDDIYPISSRSNPFELPKSIGFHAMTIMFLDEKANT